jgi:spermidine/putrescine transport system substrate-binding protein
VPPDISRRTLLRGVGAVVFVGASAATLPRFGTAGAHQSPTSCPSTDLSSSEKQLVVSNWPAYIDPIKKPTSTISVFEQQTGIDVSYADDVSDNNEFFAKVVNQLGSCQPVDRDIMVLTDWMAARMINLGWLQKLDHSNLPNVDAHLLDSLKHPDWDPDRSYSVPWQSGLTGIAYNSDLVDPVTTWKELFTRSDLNGHVTLLTEMRDTMGAALLSIGVQPEKFTDSEWDAAIDVIGNARAAGQIRAFTGNEYIQDLKAGNVSACEAWSGDVVSAQDTPNIKFVAPAEGMMLWSDNMLVPNLAAHKANAEAFMNYYYDPHVAAKLEASVNYICPVDGAQDAMRTVAKGLVDNPLIFPDQKLLGSTHSLMALNENQIKNYENDFAKVTGG